MCVGGVIEAANDNVGGSDAFATAQTVTANFNWGAATVNQNVCVIATW